MMRARALAACLLEHSAGPRGPRRWCRLLGAADRLPPEVCDRQPGHFDRRPLPIGLHAGVRPPAALAGLRYTQGRARFSRGMAAEPERRPVASPLATQVMYEGYPASVRKWIARHGGLSERLILLKGRELAAVMPACEVGPASRTHPTTRPIRS
jgi:hypothetical protein